MIESKHQLNFIEKEQRLKIQRNLVLLILNKFLLSLAVLIICFSIILVGLRFLMNLELSSIKSQTAKSISNQGNSNVSIEQATTELNNTTKRLETIQNEYIVWTPTLSSFISELPNNITVQNLQINSKDSTLTMDGVAANRESYAQLKSLLENSDKLTGSKLPVSLAKDQIPFSVKLTVKPSFFSHE